MTATISNQVGELSARCVALRDFIYREERAACVSAAYEILQTVTADIRPLPLPASLPGTLLAYSVTKYGSTQYHFDYCSPGRNQPHLRFNGGYVLASIVIAVFCLNLSFNLVQAEAEAEQVAA